MMKTISITPKKYHEMAFNKSRLPNLSEAGYISASLISKVRDPLKFALTDDGDFTETPSMRWGSLVDCLWTTPGLFDREYIVKPDDAPRKPTSAQINAKKPSDSTLKSISWWNKWESSANGKTTISESELKEAKQAVHMLSTHPVAAKLMKHSNCQVPIVGEGHEFLDVPGGVKVKALMDLIPAGGGFDDVVVDLKTTNDLSETAMHNIMFRFDYVVKLSFYSMMLEAAGYGKRPRALIIWQNSSAPYNVCVREVTDLELGKSIVHKRIEALKSISPENMSSFIDTEIKEMKLRTWAIEEYNNE